MSEGRAQMGSGVKKAGMGEDQGDWSDGNKLTASADCTRAHAAGEGGGGDIGSGSDDRSVS